MADLSSKKSDALSKLVALVPNAIDLALQIAEFQSYVTDNGFLTGGANAIVDGDCVGTNKHLDAASFNAAITAISTMTLSNPNKTTLRKVSTTPVPFN